MMRRSTIVLVAILALFATVAAQQRNPEQELLQLERDWGTANLKKDVALLNRILSEDFTAVNIRGKAETKAETLSNLGDKTSTITSWVDSNMKVRLYGDAAVVTG